ncbi:MAG: phage major capsid protein, partial [Gordonibacter sp.]
MAVESLSTAKLILPREVAKGIIRRSRDTSTIQALSPSTPQLFKDINHIIFSKEPEAEFVAEGAAKSPTSAEFTPVSGGVHKAQVTIRMNEEVQWADEDNQLEIMDAIIDAAGGALGRALDYGIYHAI